MKFYHPIYKDYYCDENGNIFSKKYFDNPYGYHHTLNKQLLEIGYWCPKIHIDKDGYRRFNLNQKTKRCNIFCYECYHNKELSNNNKFVVDHKNHIRTDDSIDNLRYISQKENIDEPHRNKLVSNAIRKNRHGKCGDGSLEEYLSTPHTLSHFKRDILKRGENFKDYEYSFYSKENGRPIKYMFKKKEGLL